MIRHAMAYVQMAELVEADLPACDLANVRRDLIAAEGSLVNAYRAWRQSMKAAADAGSPRAAAYLERTTWDLT